MNRASRRIGRYFHWSASRSAPRRVRAPHTTGPMTAKLRRQLTPRGLSSPLSLSLRVSGLPEPSRPVARPVTPFRDASVPAGAFHTPRETSVRAAIPATVPHGGLVTVTPFCERVGDLHVREVHGRVRGHVEGDRGAVGYP